MYFYFHTFKVLVIMISSNFCVTIDFYHLNNYRRLFPSERYKVSALTFICEAEFQTQSSDNPPSLLTILLTGVRPSWSHQERSSGVFYPARSLCHHFYPGYPSKFYMCNHFLNEFWLACMLFSSDPSPAMARKC